MSGVSKSAEDVKGFGGAGGDLYDAVIVGAGSAGLSAALLLGRSGRRVLLLGGGEPRNAPAASVHSFFTRDGESPARLREIGREQLRPYRGVEYRETRATEVSGTDGSFSVTLDDGDEVRARKLVLATGVADELPERPGFRELWGRGVYHCPYCHGWEVRDRPLAVLNSGEHATDYVILIRNWSRDLVLLTDGPSVLGEGDRRKLDALNVPLYEGRISHLVGRKDGSEGLSKIILEDGTALEREGLFYAPPQRQRSNLAELLGCESEAGPVGAVVKKDPMTNETSVPGVYVAGDSGSMLQSVALAVASGANAAAFLNRSLCVEDAEAESASAATSGRRAG